MTNYAGNAGPAYWLEPKIPYLGRAGSNLSSMRPVHEPWRLENAHVLVDAWNCLDAPEFVPAGAMVQNRNVLMRTGYYLASQEYAVRS